MMKSFEYAVAKNEAGVRKALTRGYKPKAGGIDLADLLKERIEPASKFVSILPAKELHGIREEAGALHIGATTTLQELASHAGARAFFAGLCLALEDAATPQVRNLATVAGNIMQRPRCWYFRAKEHNCLKKGGSVCLAIAGENQYHAVFGGGMCNIVSPSNVAAPLLAGNGHVVCRDAKGKDRIVPAAEFFTLPEKDVTRETSLADGEIITELVFPARVEKSGYVELREKQSFDWPLATATVAYVGGKWNVVLGGVAPIPWKAVKAEAVLGGTADVDAALAEKAADAALDGATPMSDNGWRLKLVRAAVRRALLTACGKSID